MIIDHIGIVVKSLSESIEHWEKVFNYKQKTEIVINTRQKVKVVFLEKKGSILIKLIEPTDSTSNVFSLSRRGGGLHHICFKCENLNTKIAELKQKGLHVIVKPEPGEAFENEDIAFIYARNNINIELIDTDKKAKIIENEDNNFQY
ncbi:VOC family protein [Marispirochaeta sp.]|uniref:VOC family protein n=1 Tax=Marispirochaeta sp. TaxID=2038653 RepID=UPI0029C7F031|nr:VOC family protein [Marispirochaeta sp.]